jgi:dephospho-CoA kinase
MKIIGITGGIGSGKTTVSNMLREVGYPVFDSDLTAKHIYNSDSSVITSLKKMFGDDIYDGKNILDRKKLASIVFTDKQSLEKLNSVIHPKVRELMFMVMKETYTDLFFVESAIMFESGLHKDMDKVICVVAPKETRIERTIKRDGVTREDVENRMRFQICDERRVFKSDYTVDTDKGLDSVKSQLFNIVAKLK